MYQTIKSLEYTKTQLDYLLHIRLVNAVNDAAPSEQLNSEITKTLSTVRYQTYPWLDKSGELEDREKKNYIRSRMALWERIFGKLDSAETQSKLNNAIEFLDR